MLQLAVLTTLSIDLYPDKYPVLPHTWSIEGLKGTVVDFLIRVLVITLAVPLIPLIGRIAHSYWHRHPTVLMPRPRTVNKNSIC